MSEKVLSRILYGVIGAFIGIVAVALLVILPLRAAALAPGAPDCGDAPCVCQDNLKELSLGILQYEQDYDEKLPGGTQANPASPSTATGEGWAGQIASYTRTVAGFQCPSDPTVTHKPNFEVSYGFNADAAGFPVVAFTSAPYSVLLYETQYDPVQLHRVNEGAAAGAFTFSGTSDGTDGHLFTGVNDTVAFTQYVTGFLGARPHLLMNSQFDAPRHGVGSNFAFADGHVHFLMPAEVSSGTNAPSPTANQTGAVNGTAAGTMNVNYQGTFSIQ